MAATLLLLVVFGILPNALVYWFYGLPSTIATVERRDPKPRWTDARPLLVIGISLVGGLSCVGGLLSVIAFWFVSGMHLPAVYFGLVIPGLLGDVTNLAVILLSLYYIRLFWKLDPRGWWGGVGLLGFYFVSGMVTSLTLSPVEITAAMSGAPLLELENAATLPPDPTLFRMIVALNALTLLVCGWLFWKVRRYYQPGASGAE